MARTVIQLRQTVARTVRDLWTGTLTTAGTAGDQQLFDTNLLVDLQNAYIHLSADAAAEDLRVRSSGDGQIHLAGEIGLAAGIAKDAVWEAHRIADVPAYNSFIRDAIIDAGGEFLLLDKDDQTISLTADATKPVGLEDEYNLPSGFRYIHEVAIADSQGFFRPFPLRQITIIPGSTKKIRFSTWALSVFGFVGRTVRLLGQSVEDVPALSDSTSVSTDAAYVRAAVLLDLTRILTGGAGVRAQAAQGQLRTMEASVLLKRETMIPDGIVMPGSVAVLA